MVLDKGFEKKKWEPTGVPTIAYLIENLDKSGWDIELYLQTFLQIKIQPHKENEYNIKISGLKIK